MLPREHRLTSGRDFRAVSRRGARVGGRFVVVSLSLDPVSPGPVSPEAMSLDAVSAEVTSAEARIPETNSGSSAAWRCGFIVSKKVGNAVVRHRTARRLRHSAAELVPQLMAPVTGPSVVGESTFAASIVVRALPSITSAETGEVADDFGRCLARVARKALKHHAGRSGVQAVPSGSSREEAAGVGSAQ